MLALAAPSPGGGPHLHSPDSTTARSAKTTTQRLQDTEAAARRRTRSATDDDLAQPQQLSGSNAAIGSGPSTQPASSGRAGRTSGSPSGNGDGDEGRERFESRERKYGGPGDSGKGGGGGGGDDGEASRTYKAISRVHRACTSCRKQKARCEGPEHPPCRRCKAANIDCIFERPPRENATSAAPDAGSERIKSLETQISDMQSMMGELVNTLKTNTRLLAQQVQVQASALASPLRPPGYRQQGHLQPSHPLAAHRPPNNGQVTPRPFTPRAQDLLQQPTTAQHSQYLQQEGYGAGTGMGMGGGASSPSGRSDTDRRMYPWSAPSPRLGGGLSGKGAGPGGGETGSGNRTWTSLGNSNDHAQPSPASNQHQQLEQQQQQQPRGHQPWSYGAVAEGLKGLDTRSATSATPELPSQNQASRVRPALQHSSSMPPPPPARDRLYSRDTEGETDISNDQLSAPIEALRGLADAAAAAADADGGAAEGEDLELGAPTPSDSGGGSRRYPSEEFLSMKDTPTSATGAAVAAAGGSRASLRSQSRVLTSEPSPADEDSGGPLKRRRTDLMSSTVQGGTGGAAAAVYIDDVSPNGVDRPGDLVSLGLVTDEEARRLFDLFGQGVPKFISMFHFDDLFPNDTHADAMETIRTRSFFLFNVILAIGALVACGGGPKNRLYHVCMAQAKRNAKDTLFAPVDGKEAVQAMVLLGSYSDNGWLPTGMSVRMAQELGLDRSFQRLMTRLPPGSVLRQPQPLRPLRNHIYHQSSPASLYTDSPSERSDIGEPILRRDEGDSGGRLDPAAQGTMEELRELARGARLWFFLFLFDHQASFGAGRPAMLSKHYVRNCRAFLTLQHPLAVDTDVRFISTLELLIIRETHYDVMGPYDQPVDARMLARMRRVTQELDEWHRYWSGELSSRGYDDSSFFQQSLILQCASAELYLTCTALRGIKDSNDTDRMGSEQKELIIQATRAADTCLSISVNSDEYREMLGWAPHYTHVTAAFACVFLIKIARLFPRQVDTYGIFSNAERLATRLAEVPATKYSRVIRILLAQAWKKITDLSPSIGLYAALGAEGSRPGAITPAEIKVGGPLDTGLALLYKLLAQHQPSAADPDGVLAPETGAGSKVGAASLQPGTCSGGEFGMQPMDTPKWNPSTAPSPQVGPSASATAAGPTMPTHRNSVTFKDEIPRHMPSWTDHAASTTTATQPPLQLPLWMQESTGSLLDSTTQLRDWVASVDEYAADGVFGGNGSGVHGGVGGMSTGVHGQQQRQQQQQQMGMTPSVMSALQQSGTASTGTVASIFDSVLSDLGLPNNGLDVLFFDRPSVAASTAETQQPTSHPT